MIFPLMWTIWKFSGQKHKLYTDNPENPLFAHADEDTIVETGPFEKLSTAGAIRLFADYNSQFCEFILF